MQKILTNITILCVEDDSVISRVYSKSLSLAGANMVMASDGDEALRILKNQKIEVILLDLEMPGTNGFDLIELHKKERVFGDRPIIVISNASALDDEDKVAWLWEAGVADIIMKCNMSLSGLASSISKVCKDNCRHL